MGGIPLSFTVVFVVYSILLLLVGILGGYLPSLVNLTHRRMQMIISFVGGLMVGIGILHMLPHAFVQLQSIDQTAWGVTLGLVAMFIFLRWFHFHDHEIHEISDVSQSDQVHQDCHDHDHDHAHDSSLVTLSIRQNNAQVDAPSATAVDHQHCQHPRHRPTWPMILSGLAIHTLLDGLALGASMKSDFSHNHQLLIGLGTFLAIVTHKPLDTLTISSMMARDQIAEYQRLLVVAGYCLICPMGAILFLFGISQWPIFEAQVLGTVLAFSAGVFICIALSDLLPEIEFHSHDRLKLTLLMLSGISVAYAISWFEPTHQHQIIDQVPFFIPESPLGIKAPLQ